MGGVFGRVIYAVVLLGVLLAAMWISFSYFVLGKSMTLPDFSEMSLDEASAMAAAQGLLVVVDATQEAFDDKIAAHKIRGQSPAPDTEVKSGQRVRVFLSKGPRTIRVPELTGLSPRTASLALRKEGLVLGSVAAAHLFSGTGVVAQGVESGSTAVPDLPVDVLVNRASPDLAYVMPDLIGRDFEKVRLGFEARGFRLGGVRSQPYEGAAAGTILRQFPLAGHPVSTKETISFVTAAAVSAEAPPS